MEYETALPPFLEFLKRNQENSGVMADLRCALIPAREYRVWQYIARFFPLEDDRARTIAATVGAAFGIQPECGGELENMGDVLHRIAPGEGGGDGLSTFVLRFQRLLACDSVEELAPLLLGVFRTARSRNIPINHTNLGRDLIDWGERVKRRWADHFWSKPKGDGADE